MKKFSEKYRPISREWLIGQSQLNAYDGLLRDMPQTVLLTGKSGVGKTTIAKLFAAHLLNCSVNELEKKFAFQYVNSRVVGIDYFRQELIENLNTPFFFSDKKVYLFDEVHALKKDSEQRVLLTVLESLPEFVHVMFCTDQPHVLDKALLSRLEPVINLSIPTMEERKKHMLKILALEGVQLEGQSINGATRTISKQDANSIYQDSSDNLRSMIDKIESWLGGYFTPSISDTNQELPFVQAFFAKGLTLTEAFNLLKDESNYNGLLHGMCGYAIGILQRDSNSSKAELAIKTLSVMGNGLSPYVSEKIAFYRLLMEIL